MKDQSFIDAVAEFCHKQEGINFEILEILRSMKVMLEDQERRLYALEKISEEVVIHYGPNGKGGLH